MHCLETIDEEKTKESSYSNTIAEKSPAVSTEDPPVIRTPPGEDHWVRTLRVQSREHADLPWAWSKSASWDIRRKGQKACRFS